MFFEGKTLELLIAAIVALIVVGPKDLPVLLRKFGQFMAKLRGMAAEFRASFDEMARQSELDELRREVEALRKGQLAEIEQATAHAEIIDDINKGLTDVGVQLHPPMSHQYGEAPSPPLAAAEPAPEKKAARSRPVAKAPRKKAVAKSAKAPAKTAGPSA